MKLSSLSVLGAVLSKLRPGTDPETAAPSYNATAAAQRYIYANMSPLDPSMCAPHEASHYRQPFLGPPNSCPVPLGAGGERLHNWLPGPKAAAQRVADMAADPTDPRSWHPWTHRPVCGTETQYCVFTLASLPASGVGSLGDDSAQGISIITTPEMAAYSAHPHQYALHPDALRMFADFAAMSPAFSVQRVGRSQGGGAIVVNGTRLTTDKGFGAVAVRDIAAGEAVVVDRPALLAHHKVLSDADAEEYGSHEDDHGLGREAAADRQRLWAAAVDQLPPAMAKRIRHDMNVLPKYANMAVAKEVAGAFSHEEQVFASNSFMLGLDSYGFKGLFPNVAVRRRRAGRIVSHLDKR